MVKRFIKITLTVVSTVIFWILLSLVQSVFSSVGTINEDITITAHRGGAGYGNENTISCIKHSLDNGVESIEIDVHLTSDSRIVVCHDESVNRTTNGKGKISEMTFEQLRALRIVDKNGDETDETIPELCEILELVDGKSHILLEIKNKAKHVGPLEQAVVDELNKYNAHEWVTVISFGDKTLETIHQIDPSLRLEKLVFFRMIGLPIIFDGGFSYFSFKKYNYVESINFFYKSVSKSLIKEMHDNNMRVRVWTINELSHTPKLDIDGIITDYPDKFIEAFSNTSNY
jgi:glycerophosphoryl diester phosphodiesterase